MADEVQGQAPMAVADDFDRDWASARAGTLTTPGQESATPAAVEGPSGETLTTPAAPQAPVTQAPAAEPEFTIPPAIQARMKEVGANSLDELLQMGRGYQSVKGQLPNLEKKWRDQHVAPMEKELNQLRAERQAAIDDFVKIDPVTQRVRTQADQAEVRRQLDEQEQNTRAAEDAQAKVSQLTEREQRVAAVEETLLRQGFTNSITLYTQDLARQHNIPADEITKYIKSTRLMERIAEMPEVSQFGNIIVELGKFAEEAAPRLQAEAAEKAAGKYRDVGASNGGAGGQQSGRRWEQQPDADFDQSWEAALAGRLT